MLRIRFDAVIIIILFLRDNGDVGRVKILSSSERERWREFGVGAKETIDNIKYGILRYVYNFHALAI